MCRFLGYIGKEPLIMGRVLDHYANSLINQSRHARKQQRGLNADGFGIGWYNHSIDAFPALFKSISPAWNDWNLRHLAAKVRSSAFIGHVRASTVGSVSLANCHPFAYEHLLFGHNGTIHGFSQIKRDLFALLDDDAFLSVKGETDSETFFALMTTLIKESGDESLDGMLEAFYRALGIVHEMQKKRGVELCVRANILLMNGHELFAARYRSRQKEESHSLYYSFIESPERDEELVFCGDTKGAGIIVASEFLDQEAEHWRKLPVNHVLLINKELDHRLIALDESRLSRFQS